VSGPFLLDPPFLRRLENLALRSRRVVRSGMQGERRSATLGRGVEFADYRGYQAGDDYRYIDWNIYSRLDRLFVKLFSAEEDINVHLLVDRSRSMGFPSGEGEGTKLHYAAQVAAAIGYIGLINLDRVSAAAFDREVRTVYGPGRGRGQALPFFRFLGELTPGGSSDLAAVMREYAHQTRRRGLLVIVSDLLMAEGVEEGLRLARGHRFEPFVVHVVSEEDLAPALAGDLRLVDSETGAAVEVSIDGGALRTFARTRDAYLGGLERFCLRHGVEYLRATTAIPVADLVLRYLRVGGLIA
jgi:uncharacterized protein (DUF58 family)